MAELQVPEKEAAGDEFGDLIRFRSDEREDVQKKTFTKWVNSQFNKVKKGSIGDLFSDLRDGRKLLDLLEILLDQKLSKERGSTRVHALNNVNRVLQVLQKNNVDLVNIGGSDIVDGNHKLTLGLIWSIILHWQVKDVMKELMADLQQTSSENVLLGWVRQSTRDYQPVNVVNFTSSWTDGLAFNALIHSNRPDLFSWKDVVEKMTPHQRLENAFRTAQEHLGVPRLLDPEDVEMAHPDKKSILLYVTSFFQVLPKRVSMEAIREVDSLTRKPVPAVDESQQRYSQQITVSLGQARASASPKPRYKSYVYTQQVFVHSPHRQRRGLSGKPVTPEEEESGGSRPETPSTITELETDVDLESYQAALEEVLAWLLSAEDNLQAQPEISTDVEEVKEQFHSHEGFMLELTSHQSSVGNVLHAGNQLLAEGKLSNEEEGEVREQMGLLNSRWESLRVASMARQARLHDILMDLQQQQLGRVSDWLSVTEERTRKLDTHPLGPDLVTLRKQLEEHKELQADLEQEQSIVHSLSHMVVVVDETTGENATVALEAQLQSLGERWANVCRWTEQRWNLLQDALVKWQQFTEEQVLFDAWLKEKEEALGQVKTTGFIDHNDIVSSVRKLAILKEDMSMKRPVMSKLSTLGQAVVTAIASPTGTTAVQRTLDGFAQQWDALVHQLESRSRLLTETINKSPPSVSQTMSTGTAITGTTVVETITMVSSKEKVLLKHGRQEHVQEPPTKRQHLDPQLKRRFDAEILELTLWLGKAEGILQVIEPTSLNKAEDVERLENKLNGLENERAEKQKQFKDVMCTGQNVAEQMERDGISTEQVKRATKGLEERWGELGRLLHDHKDSLSVQGLVLQFHRDVARYELHMPSVQAGRDEDGDIEKVKRELGKCREDVAQVRLMEPELEGLATKAEQLIERNAALCTLRGDAERLTQLHFKTLSALERRLGKLQAVLGSLPPPGYNEKVAGLKAFLEEVESRLRAMPKQLDDPEVMERRKEDVQSLQSAFHGREGTLDAVFAAVEKECRESPGEGSSGRLKELQRLKEHWGDMTVKLQEYLRALTQLEEQQRKLKMERQELTKWMDDVEKFLEEEAIAVGDVVVLEKQLQQCSALLNDARVLQKNLQGIVESGEALQSQAGPALAAWMKADLAAMNNRWEALCKQIRSRHTALVAALERSRELWKDLTEMQEWLNQAEEEYLGKDHEYKVPTDLSQAVVELKHAMDEVKQKEVKVKILKDGVGTVVTTGAGTGRDKLKAELATVMANYQRLCSRLKGKHSMVQEVWSCWQQLLQHLDSESKWLDELEEALQKADRADGKPEQAAASVIALDTLLAYPGDNRTHIEELSQTLVDGGILDDVIGEKLKALNARRNELTQRTKRRREWLSGLQKGKREMDEALSGVADALSALDRRLMGYVADHKDASQLPKQTQEMQTDLLGHEVALQQLAAAHPTPEATAQIKPIETHLADLRGRLRLFHKPADFDRRLAQCQRILADVGREVPLVRLHSSEPEGVQAQLDHCMQLYKTLSEIKSEVESVIKTGRQIVQKQYTVNSQDLDEQLTTLKHLYNDQGFQVTEGKTELEKALKHSRRLRKEIAGLTEWLALTDAELTRRSAVEEMPEDLDAELVWSLVTQKEVEKRRPLLAAAGETGASLTALLKGQENSVDDKLSLLNSNWIAVTSRTEEWHRLLQDYQTQMTQFDQNIADITTWIYHSQVLLDDAEKLPMHERENVYKKLQTELPETKCKVDRVRLQVQELGTQCGPHCSLLLEPKLKELDQRFNSVSLWINNRKPLPLAMVWDMPSVLSVQAVQQKVERQRELLESKRAGESGLPPGTYRLASLSSIRSSEPSPLHAAYPLLTSNQPDFTMQVVGPEERNFDERLKEILTLMEAELQRGEELREEDFIGEKGAEEDGVVVETLKRGENLLERTPDEKKREKLESKLTDLKNKYATIKDMKLIRRRRVVEVAPTWYQFRRGKDDLLRWLKEADAKLSALERSTDPAAFQALDKELSIRREGYRTLRKQAQELKKEGAGPMLEPELIRLEKRWIEIESKFTKFQPPLYQPPSYQLTSYQPADFRVEGKTPLTDTTSYLLDLDELLLELAKIEQSLLAPELTAGNFAELPRQEKALQGVGAELERLSDSLLATRERQPSILQAASAADVPKIEASLRRLDTEWENVNNMYDARKRAFGMASKRMERFDRDVASLAAWLAEAERTLGEMARTGVDSQVAKAKLKVNGSKTELFFNCYYP
uniref:dystrophin-like isoform X2 n=1 Tax=Myxine glutinosa TaxID=7769 RepID=UPI00358E819C